MLEGSDAEIPDGPSPAEVLIDEYEVLTIDDCFLESGELSDDEAISTLKKRKHYLKRIKSIYYTDSSHSVLIV